MNVALFRPADERLAATVELLADLGVNPVADPMLAVEPTDDLPRSDADIVVLTSRTAATILADRAWKPAPDTVLCAIGAATAAALRDRGYAVDVVPDEFSSAGLVATLRDRVEGKRVEVARSDQGSPVLPRGLRDGGADVNETVLYRIDRPDDGGESVRLAANRALDGVLFTSSLTVEHFFVAAAERGQETAVRTGLEAAVIGAIGEPTRETAAAQGVSVDVVPEAADVEALARAVVAKLR